MSKKFLIGVGNVYYYDTSDNLLFQSKTMSTSGLEVAVSNTEISGGYSNVLQFNLVHSPRLNLTLEDTQWNLGYIAANTGSTITTSASVWASETVTLGSGGAGTLVDSTPIATPDAQSAAIYGWVTYADGSYEKVEFSTKAFSTTLGAENDVVCVRFYVTDAAARQVQINSNFVPTIGRAVVETQLASSETDVASGSVIGRVQFEIPRLQLAGSQSITMTADGYSNSPLSGMALAYDSGSGACNTGSYLGKVTEIIDSANWYDQVIYLALSDSDLDLVVAGADQTLIVWAIPMSGSAFIAPNADLDFASDTTGVATVGAHTGVVHAVGAGIAGISVKITAKTTVECAAIATVTT
jgi:hypothetical protein